MASSGLGDNLKQRRQAAGLTQAELAYRAGVSYSSVSKLEQGSVTRPSAKLLQKLVGILGCDLDALMNEEPPKTVLPKPPLKFPIPNSQSPIKFVYFDIGGVLAHTESMLLQYLSARFDRPLARVKSLYHMYAPLAMRGKLQIEDIQLLFLFKLNLQYRQYKDYIFDDWVVHMRVNQPVHEFAAQVAQHYPVGILSNIIEGVLPRMQKQGLIPKLPYKHVIESCRVGLIKPEPQIYELATKLAGVEPHEILFIDDQKINVKAAREYGWQAEWFNEVKTTSSLARIQRKYF